MKYYIIARKPIYDRDKELIYDYQALLALDGLAGSGPYDVGEVESNPGRLIDIFLENNPGFMDADIMFIPETEIPQVIIRQIV